MCIYICTYIHSMQLSGIAMDNLLYKKIEDISIMMGEYFQAHDDYLDIFGDFTQTGKMGSDIQNNKLTWLLIKAFELCSESDKEKIIKNYGKNNVASVKIIDNIYEKYNIKEHYNIYEQTQKDKIIEYRHSVYVLIYSNFNLKYMFNLFLSC
ncbi:farnesyl pyrophosphate synthase [Plasmodium yoelii yoelii]|uniref:Farnesyl pyrophosphate synthase n=1 Tax=Plasmodium yoelii yoelii TaxID=73239 RepID=Q7RC65_PLAYO|nr:farnesyl pyrophosphate synthase [Plasmodium yoelii yoelii]